VSVERQDKILTCKDCGDEFIFTIREQDFYFQKGFEHDPARCTTCRSARKRDRSVNSAGGNSPSYGNSMGGNTYNGGLSGGYYSNNSGNRAQPPGGRFGSSNNYGRGSYGNQSPNYGNGYGGGNNAGYGNSNGNSNGNGNGNGGGYNRGTYGNSGGNRLGSSNFANQGQERKMYPITCANCGVQTEVPFTPRQGVPVFCRTCYNTQKSR